MKKFVNYIEDKNVMALFNVDENIEIFLPIILTLKSIYIFTKVYKATIF